MSSHFPPIGGHQTWRGSNPFSATFRSLINEIASQTSEIPGLLMESSRVRAMMESQSNARPLFCEITGNTAVAGSPTLKWIYDVKISEYTSASTATLVHGTISPVTSTAEFEAINMMELLNTSTTVGPGHSITPTVGETYTMVAIQTGMPVLVWFFGDVGTASGHPGHVPCFWMDNAIDIACAP